jgi:hypothetical protein
MFYQNPLNQTICSHTSTCVTVSVVQNCVDKMIKCVTFPFGKQIEDTKLRPI